MDISEKIGLAAELACLLEVSAEKPGNVTPTHDFKDTRYQDFLVSAVAIGKAFRNISNATVGETILQAVKDTKALTSVNTNLGIILLLVPLAKAYSFDSNKKYQETLNSVLKHLTIKDAELTYEAIRLANPGGLGKADRYDVSETPVGITLLEAMQEAGHRDNIAGEYESGYQITFRIGLPTLNDAIKKGSSISDAIIQTFLVILSWVPDTLIARKTGIDKALDVSNFARKVLDCGGVFNERGHEEINRFNSFLREPNHNLNPGATADLIAAILFVYLMDNNMKFTEKE